MLRMFVWFAATAFVLHGNELNAKTLQSSTKITPLTHANIPPSGAVLVGDSSFEYITTTTSFVRYPSGSSIGSWNTTGRVHIAYKGIIGMPLPNPSDLSYECMFQTYFGNPNQPYANYSSVEKSFTKLIIGASYRLSFYHTMRFNTLPPQSYAVILGGITVYSTVPSDYGWVKVTLSDFIANSSFMSLKFAISSTDEQDRNIGINAVNLLLVSGIVIL
jgi:hypothetical protein